MPKKCCQTFSLNLDLFSLPISLFFQGNKRRFTYIGTIFSLFLYLLLIVVFFESDFYNKRNPIIVKQNKRFSHANLISFDESKILTISVVDNQGNAIADPSIYTFQFVVTHQKVNSTTGLFQHLSQDDKNLHPCTLNDTNNNTALWNELSPINAYCLENKSFSVEGGWNENDVQFVYIALNACNNATSPVTCAGSEKIRTFFDATPRFMCVQYHNTEIDFYDYQEPIKTNYAFGFPQINFNSTKKNFIYLKEASLRSDMGWLFSSFTEYKSFMFDRSDADWLPRVDNRIFITHIYASQNQEVDTRRYQKLPEAVASLIGMSKLYVIFFGLFVNFFNEFQTMKIILRKLNINNLGKRANKVRLSRLTNEMRKSHAVNLNKKSNFLKQSFGEKLNDSKNPKNNITKETRFQKTAKNIIKRGKQILEKFKKHAKRTENEIEQNLTVRKLSITNIPLENEQKNVPYATFAKSSIEILNTQKTKTAIEGQSQIASEKFKIDFKNSIQTYSLKQIPKDFTHFSSQNKSINFKNQIDDHTVHFSLYDYFMSIFLIIFKKSEQQKKIERLKKIYTKKLDLIKILTYLKEFKALKRVVLDEDQKVIFDFINKPSIEIHEKDNKRKIYKKQLRKEKFMVSYKNILQRMNEVDARLFLLADENIETGE